MANISQSGLRFETGNEIDLYTTLRVKIYFHNLSSSHSTQSSLNVLGQVVWEHETTLAEMNAKRIYGLDFIQLSEADEKRLREELEQTPLKE